MKERTTLDQSITRQRELEQELDDSLEFILLGEEEDDAATVEEAEATLRRMKEQVDRLSLEALLSGEADSNDSYLEVHAGAGGTESQDWAEMLLRMYVRWAEKRGYKIEWIEESGGEEAGIKSATVRVQGHNAYGWLKSESGVHRLVRISPYDSQSRRHTSFASVGAFPAIDDEIDIEIEDKDLRVDTYRASGAGGQHVNTTDSAIRITHIPTNVIVQCQNDRSQHKNKASAMKMLKSRLFEYEMAKKQAAIDGIEKSDIGWGHQIRSYVMQPYQQVKDTRSNQPFTNVDAILDGDIDKLLEGVLIAQAK